MPWSASPTTKMLRHLPARSLAAGLGVVGVVLKLVHQDMLEAALVMIERIWEAIKVLQRRQFVELVQSRRFHQAALVLAIDLANGPLPRVRGEILEQSRHPPPVLRIRMVPPPTGEGTAWIQAELLQARLDRRSVSEAS